MLTKKLLVILLVVLTSCKKQNDEKSNQDVYDDASITCDAEPYLGWFYSSEDNTCSPQLVSACENAPASMYRNEGKCRLAHSMTVSCMAAVSEVIKDPVALDDENVMTCLQQQTSSNFVSEEILVLANERIPKEDQLNAIYNSQNSVKGTGSNFWIVSVPSGEEKSWVCRFQYSKIYENCFAGTDLNTYSNPASN